MARGLPSPFKIEPLREVIAKMYSYRSGQIMIKNSEIGQRMVNGSSVSISSTML
jgi:ferric-dicitrate binding protein FerR (iron transport regulator)